MKTCTQRIDPTGDCWQTCVACLLEVDPETLPDQIAIEAARENEERRKWFDGWLSYGNALQGYLGKHHQLMWFEYPYWQLEALGLFAGWFSNREHMICGPTERGVSTGIEHVVLAVDGEPVFDPHPTRAGLLPDRSRWRAEFLVAVPPHIAASRAKQAKESSAFSRVLVDCLCPSCFDQEQLK